MMSGSHLSNLSKDFFELVKSIGESRSKQEEDKIITLEVYNLKEKMVALAAHNHTFLRMLETVGSKKCSFKEDEGIFDTNDIC